MVSDQPFTISPFGDALNASDPSVRIHETTIMLNDWLPDNLSRVKMKLFW
ncbi:hypothetical protein ABENE_08245 [Asticcacaulis benevestitus DSM 16100 = ATCC BAA-896]|uniref:Uncharacterized protein n=1 Tax=Asticcacaulis benevestitus DSM 16100 = ATCC BAA-896 TaxID=1121022 RepID=V4PVF3_9CAUL|nr:hypothetical protein ABENE_08245 [Asticcacaulis benevestitus DSM 16100 = ATCC BAA-896]